MKSFVKSAGGKAKLAPAILASMPSFTGRYYEPFVGGGAVFAALYVLGRAGLGQPAGARSEDWAVLSDANADLMNVYEIVKTEPHGLIAGLKEIKHYKENYYRIRAEVPKDATAAAVRYVYLNKTCFNGLYRVNAAGKFNVPIGSYKNPTIAEPEVIMTWHRALRSVKLFSEDFRVTVGMAKKGDFVYCDPPYLPRSKTADFTSYTADKFGLDEHERLASDLDRADARGVKWMCSQGDSPAIRALYKNYQLTECKVQHSVGAAAESRVRVHELLISNAVTMTMND